MRKEAEVINKRNYGIDLLRIIAMLYVVVLHTFGKGGILGAVEVGTPQYMFSWFGEIWAYCAVNIFALISGYVTYTEYEKKHNFSNYLVTWFQVVCYGVVVTLIFNFINPNWVTKKDLFQMLFPVTNGLYWYFTAYTGVFICMPFINAGLRKCTKTFLKKMFIMLFVLFSVFDIFVNRFVLSQGYSFVWLLILYVLGAIIKKCDIGRKIKGYQAFLGIVICCLFCWIWKIKGIELQIFDIIITENVWISYTSPLILGIAILYIIVFSKMKFNNVLQKTISFAAPSAFAVYILNNQRFVWNYVMTQRFAYLAQQSVIVIFVQVLAFSCLFVILSILIDRVRIKLFSVFRIKQLADYLVRGGEKILNYVIRIL